MGFFSRVAQWFVAPPEPAPSRRAAFRSKPTKDRYPSVSGLSILPRKATPYEEKKKTRVPSEASPPYIQTVSTWDIQSALSAVNEHERGNMNRSGLLWKWMMRDDRLKTVMNVRCSGLSALPFEVLPASDVAAPPDEVKAATQLKAGWKSSFPDDTIRAMLRLSVGMGVVVGRISWHAGKFGYWWPKITLWPEESIRYDDAGRCWWAQTREGGEARVTPGDGHWFLWEPDGARGWQLGAVMALALPVLITAFDWQDWVNFNDAHGRPIRKVMVPRGASPDEVATFLANVKALGRTTSSIVCRRQLTPNDDFGFEYVTPTSQGIVDTFIKSIDAANAAKATLILGQTLTTDAASGGNRALGDVHQQIKNQILQADAEGLANALGAQVIHWWAIYNLGRASLAPRPHWQASLPADLTAKAQTLSALAKAAQDLETALIGTDKQLDKVALLEEAGIPMTVRPPSQVPEVANSLNVFQSEGLLGAIIAATEGTEYEINLGAILTQAGLPFTKRPKAPPAPLPPPPEQEQKLAA